MTLPTARLRFSLLAVALATVIPATARAEEPTAAPDPPEGRRLPLDECVAIAVRQNPDALFGELEVEGAIAAKKGVRGEFLPKLRLEGNVFQWDSAFELPFALPGAPGPPPVLTVRDAFTWSGTASIIQPLTGLFAIYGQYKARELGIDVAAIQRDATRRDVAFRVAEAYFRLLEAIRLSAVSEVSVSQLEAQLRQAQSLHANGVIAKNDLLRADLALAGARQRLIQSRGQVVIGRGRLASMMGLPPDTTIEPIAFTGEPPPNDEPTIASAEAHAAARRLELREIDRRIEQGNRRVHAAREKLLPQASVVGSYSHVEGSAFSQKNAAYAGVVASWDAWDWGTTVSGITEADAKRRQAVVARGKLQDEVRLEARQAYVAVETSREALAVARAAVVSAEENYRIMSKRFEAAASTSFDVVDAEAPLTQARAQVETALYGHLIARGALQRATGAALPTMR